MDMLFYMYREKEREKKNHEYEINKANHPNVVYWTMCF